MESSVLRQALLKLNMSSELADVFVRFWEKSVGGPTKVSNWDAIHSPDEENLLRHDSLAAPDSSTVKSALSKFVMCKLNGGLGTGMGCTGPKSSIVVRDGKTFLDLIVEQLREAVKEYGVAVPLLLMNSFYTHDDTQKILDKFY